jgi:hypothetical protein
MNPPATSVDNRELGSSGFGGDRDDWWINAFRDLGDGAFPEVVVGARPGDRSSICRGAIDQSGR